MKVPFLDLGRLHGSIADELSAAYSTAVEQSAFMGGTPVADFEAAFGSAHSASGAAGCGSGTDALALSLRALGVGPGDEVIVPSMTFVATAEAVAHVGATPVIADIDPVTLLLSPGAVERARSSRTRAVIPVHLYGHVVPFEHLDAWRHSGLLVIEDAAQAHLATYQGRPVGSAGHVACFSFFPGKNLGALGDGGCVISNDQSVVDDVKRLRDHGRRTKYEHNELGWCSRLDALQAAFLSVKLRHLPQWTEHRRRLAARYADRLREYLVPWEEGAVHHLVVARITRGRRSDVAMRLNEEGVATGIHYPVALSQQPSCKGWSALGCHNGEQAATEVLSLPIDPLMTNDEVDFVCETLERALSRV